MNDSQITAVRDALACWLQKPTWFSSHPIDKKQLQQAIRNLKKLEQRPSLDVLERSIFLSIENLPAMLGSPMDLAMAAKQFAKEIDNKLSPAS